MNAAHYAEPRALRQAITDRLRGLARTRPGAQLADLQRQFAYDRLLYRVFAADPDRWVIKGATAMLARLQGVARHTVDIDLFRSPGDMATAEHALREAAALPAGDHFLLVLGPGRPVAQEGRALRVPVVAHLGATEFATFSVDLSTDLSMTGTPDEVPPLVPIDLPGVPRASYRAYPVEDHIADKLCAMFEVHLRGQGPPQPSTRYRDLLDLVVFARHVRVRANALTTALRSEFARRRLPLPDRVVVPGGAGWRAGYSRAARDSPMLEERDLDAAVRTVAQFLDPVLAGTAAGTWEPASLDWTTDRDPTQGARSERSSSL